MINAQLQEMLTKLESKLKREVQQRIENQRKLQTTLHETGSNLERSLLSNFDSEIASISAKLQQIEASLQTWEPQLLKDLTKNRQTINAFDLECSDTLNSMRLNLQSEFQRTQDFETRVLERSKEFENRVYNEELIQLENERDEMEKEMTRKIMEYNFKVKEEGDRLDEQVRAEIIGIREEIERERGERKAYDQALLEGVQQFLINLQ